ncbi:MAG TPA: hypothetical protein VFP89_14210 [Propionibacteriaceae bacterium]|nr:hypothetical protein [Propionibacteriaceae bacterium]
MASCVLGLLIDIGLSWLTRNVRPFREALDRREFFVGSWLQYNVRDVFGASSQQVSGFAIFVVSYDARTDTHSLAGRAYRGQDGGLEARWNSEPGFLFSPDYRKLTYVFQGTVADSQSGADPSRRGIVEVRFNNNHVSGEGTVHHVATKTMRLFDLHKITDSWLASGGHRIFAADLDSAALRDKFAAENAESLTRGSAGTEGPADPTGRGQRRSIRG